MSARPPLMRATLGGPRTSRSEAISLAMPIPYVHFGIGLLTALLSVPLVFRLVPMNRLYGIRTRQAFASNGNWYELNVYGGKLLLGFGLFLVVFALLGGRFAPAPTSLWAPAYLAIPLAALVPVIALIKAFSQRLGDR